MAALGNSRALPAPRSPLPTGDDLRDSSAALLAQASEVAERLPLPRELDVPDQVADALAPAPAKSHGRLIALDAARVFATFAVIWTHVVEMQGHSSEVAALGRFGTSFYVGAAVLLATRGAIKRPDRTIWADMKHRAQRLLVPFALWSAIYATYYASLAIPRGATIAELTVWWGPFAGCARHLWFLPFAFFAGSLAKATAPWVARLSDSQLLWGTVLGSGAAYWYCHEKLFFVLDRYWAIDWHLHRMDRWIEELPLMVLTIGLAHLFTRREARESEAGAASAANAVTIPPVSGVRLRRAAQAAVQTAATANQPTGNDSLTTTANQPTGNDSLTTTASQPSQPIDDDPGSGSFWAKDHGVAPILLTLFIAFEAFYFYGYEFLNMVSHSEARYVANFAGLALLAAFLLSKPRRWMQRLSGLGKFTYFAFLAHVLLLDWGNHKVAGLNGFGTLAFSAACSLAVLLLLVSVGKVLSRVPVLRRLLP